MAQEIRKLLSLIADKAEVSEVSGEFVGRSGCVCHWEFFLNFPLLQCLFQQEKFLGHVAYE